MLKPLHVLFVSKFMKWLKSFLKEILVLVAWMVVFQLAMFALGGLLILVSG